MSAPVWNVNTPWRCGKRRSWNVNGSVRPGDDNTSPATIAAPEIRVAVKLNHQLSKM